MTNHNTYPNTDQRGLKMNLLERIDLALRQAGKSRGQLAAAIDLSTQAISNLKRRPGSTLRPENVAKAARFMHCDLYWLCTGEGAEYEPEKQCGPTWSFLACEVAAWMDSLPEPEQQRAFALIYQVFKEGHAAAGLAPAAEIAPRTRPPRVRDKAL